jgi:hypothetical protein
VQLVPPLARLSASIWAAQTRGVKFSEVIVSRLPNRQTMAGLPHPSAAPQGFRAPLLSLKRHGHRVSRLAIVPGIRLFCHLSRPRKGSIQCSSAPRRVPDPQLRSSSAAVRGPSERLVTRRHAVRNVIQRHLSPRCISNQHICLSSPWSSPQSPCVYSSPLAGDHARLHLLREPKNLIHKIGNLVSLPRYHWPIPRILGRVLRLYLCVGQRRSKRYPKEQSRQLRLD